MTQLGINISALFYQNARSVVGAVGMLCIITGSLKALSLLKILFLKKELLLEVLQTNRFETRFTKRQVNAILKISKIRIHAQSQSDNKMLHSIHRYIGNY